MRAVKRKNTDDPAAEYTTEDHFTSTEFFEHGMGYTIYSRCRRKAGVRVMMVGDGLCPRHLVYRIRPNFLFGAEGPDGDERAWNPLGMGMDDPAATADE